MSLLFDMTKQTSRTMGERLKRICSPLVGFMGINHFYHFVYTDAGHFAVAGLDQRWQEFLHATDEMVPAVKGFYHNREQLRGILFCQTIPNKYWQNIAKTGGEKFNVHNGLQIVHKTDAGIEGFGFALNTDDPHQHMALLQELPLLNLFIDQYKNEIGSSLIKDSFIDLVEIYGPSLLKAPTSAPPDMRKVFLGKMKFNIENPFSKRELEVIRELIKGSPTASQVADALYLSKRTIEDHLDNIKVKLDCHSKHELMQELKRLESFGLFF